ncbi:hypothetical protein JOF53_005598 [Crossiella equi]|uniref:Uncharacterized protein n=1 Tax=Crossiella equi TaxID=130796 RepID=A0ABS5AJH8_9PSEU|nr:hypothetical protein [Crossiella equi]MBP2476726.1 hypothetical protein [Crossiella equi]
MKKFLVGAAVVTGAVLSAAAPAQAAVLEAQTFTATGMGVSPSGAVAEGERQAFFKASAAGYPRSQCYVQGTSVRASTIPGTWFGTVALYCTR